MPFEKGHPPYRRKTRLETVDDGEVLERSIATPIRRAVLDAWLLDRLNDRWPGISEATRKGKFAGFAASNDYLFIENDTGVLLLEMKRHAMTGRPEVLEVFAWSRGSHIDKMKGSNWVIPQKSEAERELFRLYTRGCEWARSMRAVRIEMGRCSDIAPSQLKHEFDGDYIVDVIL